MPATATTFLDNPLLKVSRPVAACSRCRTAKIKCDGKLPACSACERVGKASSCSGASDEFAKGKERSYVASLEGYCEKLEKKITRLRARQDSLSAEGSSTITREVSITSTASAGPPGPAHRREASDIDDLVGDFGFLLVHSSGRMESWLIYINPQVGQCDLTRFSRHHFEHLLRQSAPLRRYRGAAAATTLVRLASCAA